jgi:hypothetical protein
MTTPEDSGRGVRPEPDAIHHFRGTLREVTEELQRLAVGWEHFGKDANAARCREAMMGLMRGSFSVRVGVTTYTVEPVVGSSVPHPSEESDMSQHTDTSVTDG